MRADFLRKGLRRQQRNRRMRSQQIDDVLRDELQKLRKRYRPMEIRILRHRLRQQNRFVQTDRMSALLHPRRQRVQKSRVHAKLALRSERELMRHQCMQVQRRLHRQIARHFSQRNLRRQMHSPQTLLRKANNRNRIDDKAHDGMRPMFPRFPLRGSRKRRQCVLRLRVRRYLRFRLSSHIEQHMRKEYGFGVRKTQLRQYRKLRQQQQQFKPCQ